MVSHSYLRASGLLRLFRFLEHWIDNLGDRAVTSSWANTEEIQKIRKNGDVTTVLDGVNVARYLSLPSREALRRKYRVPEEKIVFTYSGALIANKGIQLLLQALPIVFEKSKEAHFVIAGFPWNEVEAFFESKPWMDRVTVITPLPYFSLPEINSLSDIGVDPKEPALTAQASGKMLQYMGAALPVACFDAPNNHEYLDMGGEYAKEVSAAGLADAILRLVEDKESRLTKGAMNQKRAIDRFSWERTGELLEKIYLS